MSDKNKENKEQKVQETEIKNKKVKAPKIDYKKKFEESQEQVELLNNKIKELVFENNKNVDAFQDKAKGFQSKAQEEINKVKAELRIKAEADATEIRMYGAQRLIENILDPINNIELAISAGEKSGDASVMAYVQGFKMLMGQLFSELEAYGIQTILPKEGDEFDPELHHAFSLVDGEVSNVITTIKKKGFKLHERVIKPALVIVTK